MTLLIFTTQRRTIDVAVVVRRRKRRPQGQDHDDGDGVKQQVDADGQVWRLCNPTFIK